MIFNGLEDSARILSKIRKMGVSLRLPENLAAIDLSDSKNRTTKMLYLASPSKKLGNSMKVSRALISISDKTGIVDFARGLQEMGIEIISTGGTAEVLRKNGIKVKDVSEITGFGTYVANCDYLGT